MTKKLSACKVLLAYKSVSWERDMLCAFKEIVSSLNHEE
jgi:hypothetical protein